MDSDDGAVQRTMIDALRMLVPGNRIHVELVTSYHREVKEETMQVEIGDGCSWDGRPLAIGNRFDAAVYITSYAFRLSSWLNANACR